MKFSIITINYNNKNGLKKTIESVVNQSYKNFEYIVIDGGSTDGSVDIIKEYDKHIDYWVSEQDKGIYNAMNKGIMQAHGDYLNFMNSGDCFYNEKVLENVVQYLKYDIVIGKAFYEGCIHGFQKKYITMLDFFKGYLNHQASFIHKKLFTNRFYDENFKIISDWIFFIETLIYETASFHNLDVVVCNFESGGISKNYPTIIEKERNIVLQKLFPPRILEDYNRWKEIDSPLLDTVAELNNTVGFQKITKHYILFMIKLKKLKDRFLR